MFFAKSLCALGKLCKTKGSNQSWKSITSRQTSQSIANVLTTQTSAGLHLNDSILFEFLPDLLPVSQWDQCSMIQSMSPPNGWFQLASNPMLFSLTVKKQVQNHCWVSLAFVLERNWHP